MIFIGYLDDLMTSDHGPTELDAHFVNDTGLSSNALDDLFVAWRLNMQRLRRKVASMGGFYEQMVGGGPGGPTSAVGGTWYYPLGVLLGDRCV